MPEEMPDTQKLDDEVVQDPFEEAPEETEDAVHLDESEELSALTIEELNHRRRTASAELERRERVEDGQERVGQVAHEYLLAARVDCEHTPTELGQIIIDHITAEPEQTEVI